MSENTVMRKMPHKRLKTNDSRLSDAIIITVVALAALVTVYPFYYVIINSFSDPMEVLRRGVWIVPKGFTLEGYRELMNQSEVFVAYGNTLWYTIVGTSLNVIFTMMAAYALSIKTFCLRKFVSLFITITMFVSGGIIPTYIVVCKTGLYDSRWSLVIPTLVSAYNLIIARTYLESIPYALTESAKIDGANDFIILVRIIVPLAKPIISLLCIYYAVQHWNEYFNPMIYLKDRNLKPIQLYLRDILVANTTAATQQAATGSDRTVLYEQLKFTNIVITVLPITIIYPFFQKYFVKGVMIGSVKG